MTMLLLYVHVLVYDHVIIVCPCY